MTTQFSKGLDTGLIIAGATAFVYVQGFVYNLAKLSTFGVPDFLIDFTNLGLYNLNIMSLYFIPMYAIFGAVVLRYVNLKMKLGFNDINLIFFMTYFLFTTLKAMKDFENFRLNHSMFMLLMLKVPLDAIAYAIIIIVRNKWFKRRNDSFNSPWLKGIWAMMAFLVITFISGHIGREDAKKQNCFFVLTNKNYIIFGRTGDYLIAKPYNENILSNSTRLLPISDTITHNIRYEQIGRLNL